MIQLNKISLGLGFQAASSEYQICWFNEKLCGHPLSDYSQVEFVNPEYLKEFETESVNFAKTCEAFGKLLGDENVHPEKWRRIRLNYKRYFFEEMSRQRRSMLKK